MKTRINLLLFFFLSFFLSCDSSYYSQSESLNGNWNKNQTLDFPFEIKHNQDVFDIFFVIRNTNDYKYTNIWFLTTLIDLETKKEILIDTIQYDLADRKTGKWLGDGITKKELKTFYKENYRFSKKGNYLLKVKQGMRENNLKGIEDFSIIIQKKR
jgi:gliding motility-associated lipoprotein GldH